MKTCSKCILPANYPGISFDHRGVCRFCLEFKTGNNHDPRELYNTIKACRDINSNYDCMVAMDGQKESAFAAYFIVKELKLKALAFTFDNGFMSQQARENIEAAVDALGMDHVKASRDNFEKDIRRMISAWIHCPFPELIGLFCSGCKTGYRRRLMAFARHYSIPVIIEGNSGTGQPIHPGCTGLTARFKSAGLLKSVLRMTKGVLKNPRLLMDSACLVSACRDIYYRAGIKRGLSNLRILSFFNFFPRREHVILPVIRDKLSWRIPEYANSSFRGQCKIRILREYLYGATLGYNNGIIRLSDMIRRHLITRSDALSRTRQDNFISQLFIREFLDEMELNYYDLAFTLRDVSYMCP
jgi:hypothetical protein